MEKERERGGREGEREDSDMYLCVKRYLPTACHMVACLKDQ